MVKIIGSMVASFAVAMGGSYGAFKFAAWLVGGGTKPAEHWLQVFFPIVIGLMLFVVIYMLIEHMVEARSGKS